MSTFRRSCAALACAAAALPGAALADTITITGAPSESTEATGCDFFAELEWIFDSGSLGTLTIEITNTTPAAVGGYLTGIVFNINSTDAAASAPLLSTTDPDFLDTGTAESASPFGKFDAGAALGADWLGGGSPQPGIAVGDTETFVFRVSAFDASALTAADFAVDGPASYNFVARFRGLDGGGSDKVPVPAPAATGALALAGIATLRRRRRPAFAARA